MALNLRRLRPYAPVIAIALAAATIAWAFAVTVLRHTRPMGLPLDDSYIYLTYAKQFGRGQPFTYFPGGGYSAGSTSVVWPMLLAPFWALGARGHALVWVSFLLCGALYTATILGCYQLARRISGELAGITAAVVLLSIAPFVWTSLSGMEVALASALLIAILLLLLDAPKTGAPGKRLVACLAAASLSRPEATLLVLAIVGIAVHARIRQRDLRAAAWWLLPLAPSVAWLVANKLLAGNFFPNTGVAKSHFYLPGFDWTYWYHAVVVLTGRMLKGLFWDGDSPLLWPRVVAVLWVVGAVRVVHWAWRAQQRLVGIVLVVSPLVLMLAVIASSGLWNFQNYRYIAPAFPLLIVPVACALVPVVDQLWLRRGWIAAIAVGLALFVRSAIPGLRADALLFAQGAMDTNTQVVAIGEYIHAKLPDARVMFHDAGAVAYYGDGRVFDMLGLVTNHQAGIANNGPGSRFEFLESLPPEQRPTHFVYYPAWLGTPEFFGEVLMHTSIHSQIEPRRLVGDSDMQVIVASWDHVGTGERPLIEHAGWAVVDRVDVADLESERAHQWRGAIGRRQLGEPTARWSMVGRDVGAYGLVLDGGRTIRGGTERFTIAIDPAKPTRLVLRTGGQSAYPYHETITKPVTLRLLDDRNLVVGTVTLPVPAGPFAEVTFALAPGVSTTLHTEASEPYRVFHWFVLQPQ